MDVRSTAPRYYSQEKFLKNRRSILGLASVFLANATVFAGSKKKRIAAPAESESEAALPPGRYSTSWVGNTFDGSGTNGFGRWVQDEIMALTVTAGGAVVTASAWDEAGRCTGLYRDGDVNRRCLMTNGAVQSHAWAWGTAGNAVAVAKNNIFIVNTKGDLLHFLWAAPPDINSQITFHGYVHVGVAVAMAAKGDRLVLVLRNGEIQIRSQHDMALLNKFSLPGAAGVAIDSKATLWMLVHGKIIHCDQVGTVLPGSIDNLENPVAVSIDKGDRMLVCDNGKRQQVLSYRLSAHPQLQCEFGQRGGLRAGTPGQMAPDKFFGLRGAGADDAGNLYVGMCFGPNPNSPTVIRSFDPAGKLRWEVSKYAWVTAFCFDPKSDGTVIYGPEEIFSFKPSQPPGKGWKARAITLDAIRYPNDPRIKGTNACSTDLRYVKGRRLLYLMGQLAGGFELYAFEPAPSEIARHVGRVVGGGFAWSVDANGGIWRGQGPRRTIWHYEFKKWSATGAPVFKPPVHYAVPDIFTEVARAHYVSETDTMYIGGYTRLTKKKSWGLVGGVLARYDGWTGGSPKLRWNVDLPLDGHGFPPKAFDVAGDYIFTVPVYPTNGKNAMVTVLNIADGAKADTFWPGAAVGHNSGWIDMIHAIHACQRSNGEYLVLVEEDWRGKNIVYQWRPATPPK